MGLPYALTLGGARVFSQDGNRLRGHPKYNWILALAVIAAAAISPTSHASSTDTRPSTKATQPAPPAHTPAGDPDVAAKPQPTDLHPRPLGANREAKPSIAPRAEAQSAGSTLWNNPTVRTGGSLLLVLALIFVLATLARRVGGKSVSLAAALGPGGKAPEGLLEVIGRYPVARGQTLVLLKLDSRILLLSQTLPRIRGGVGALATLCEITHPEEVASILVKAGEHDGKSHTARFSALLHAFDRSHAQPPHEDHTELDLRAVQQTDAGDRAELWDDQAAPVVHKFPPAIAKPPAAEVRMPAPHIPHFTPPQMPGSETFHSIRQRLHALKGEAHR